LAVRFGLRETRLGTGFTTNLSARGLGIATHAIHPIGTRLNLELSLPSGDKCQVEALVAWAQRGVAQFRTPGGMGLQIIWADESYFRLIADLMTADRASPPTGSPKIEPNQNVLGRIAGISGGVGSEVLSAHQPNPIVETISAARVELTVTTGATDSAPALTYDHNAAPDPVPSPVEEAPAAPAEPASLVEMPEAVRIERAHRFVEQLPIRFGTDESLSHKGFTLNLSRTGLALVTKSPFRLNEPVHLSIATPDGVLLSGGGQIVWTREESIGDGVQVSAGLQLTHIDISYDELLEMLQSE
jgi:hypothetical protein